MFERAIRGEIQLEDSLLYKGEEEEKAKQWDPIADMEKERQEGLINQTIKRLEGLQ